MRRSSLTFILGFNVISLAASEDTLRAPYWPLVCEPAATSMFCDYRPGHLHSGTDIKTWGAVGVPVVCEAEGYVFRAGVSTAGYGKVLYIKLDNGEYRVYAHLSDFTPEVAALVRKEQYAAKSYAVQLYLEKDRVRVKKGQVIAKSGATGVGVPHLHFEHRSGENVPLNALRRGLKVKDTRPPTLTRLALKPLGPGATVAGAERPLILKLLPRGGAFVAESAAVQAYGAVGLALEAYDMADAADNRFGLYRKELSLDDSAVFSSGYDSLDFERTRQVHLDRDLALIRQGEGTFENLYIETGNALPFYGPFRAGSGVLSGLRPGLHRLRLRCQDASGNVSSAELTIDFFNPPVVERLEILPGEGTPAIFAEVGRGSYGLEAVSFGISPDGRAWKNITVTGKYFRFHPEKFPDGGFFVRAVGLDSLGHASRALYAAGGLAPGPAAAPARAPLELAVEGEVLCVRLNAGAPLRRPPELAAAVNGVRFPLPPARSEAPGLYHWKFTADYEGGGELVLSATLADLDGSLRQANRTGRVFTLKPGRASRTVSEDGRGTVTFPQGALLQPVLFFIEPYADTLLTRTWPELSYGGPAYRMVPAIIYYDRSVTVGISADRREKTGIFTSMGEAGWRFLSPLYDEKTGRYEGDIRENIPFALFSDTVAPSLTLATDFRPGDTLTAGRLVFRVSDKGSGISSDKNITAELDGAWRLNEYDPEEGETAVFLEQVPRGAHRLTMSVRDNLKNENRLDIPFILP